MARVGRDEAPVRDPQPASAAATGAALAAGRNVTRRFGAHLAVDDVSVEVAPGEIVGLIGANGAGKTTFLRCLIGLDTPDGGEVQLFGAPPSSGARERLGYVPQGLGLYRTISVDENAEFFSRVYRVPEPALPASLAAVHRDAVGAIGLGRQRQLAFALALAHEPELLVLDEPTSGVDPLSRARLWDIVHAQADAGVGVIVTTHYLQEAEQCTRLALLSQGRLVGTGSVVELTAQARATLVETDDWQRAFAVLSAAGLPTMLSGRAIRVAGSTPDEVRAALGGIPASVAEVPPTLEEAMVLREG
ncbi:MAG: ABC transporter ATP-binding protein [Microbacterium sp.]|nr:ABC transporter ATP-binding protein [Microbacterium sp.]